METSSLTEELRRGGAFTVTRIYLFYLVGRRKQDETAGDGLINPLYPLHDAVTAKDGSFRLYLPNREPGEADPFAPGGPAAKLKGAR